MSEIIRTVKKKDVVTGVLHILFNLAVAGLSMALLLLFPGTPWPALGLVLISKWRVFAVKPRFWIPNILSNLTDLVFCAGLVILTWHSGDFLWLQIILTALYAAWLIILKPQTKPTAGLLQASLSQFIGITALFSVSEYLSLPITMFLAFGIGFAAARHVLVQHEEKQFTLLAIVWGVLTSEMSFVAYHWTITYGIGPVQIPEIAVISVVLAFIAERYYTSFRRNGGQIKQDDVVLPTLFAAAFMTILLIFFSGLFTTSL